MRVCPGRGNLGVKWVQEPESQCKRDALTAAPSAQPVYLQPLTMQLQSAFPVAPALFVPP